MKKCLYLFIFIYLIYLFRHNKEIIKYLTEVNTIFFTKYIVSLFPFILTTNLILSNGLLIDFHRFFTKQKLIFIYDLFIIIIIILIGIPGNINLLNYLEKTNIISNKRKNLLLNSFGGISFPFLYFVILNQSQNKVKILVVLLIIEFLFYLLNKEKEKYKEVTYASYQINIVSKTGYSLYVVFFSLLTFSSLYLLFDFLPTPYSLFFNGLVEFSINLIYLSKETSLISSLLFTFLLSFTSISLISQIILIDPHINIMDYIKKRAIIALLVTILIFLSS